MLTHERAKEYRASLKQSPVREETKGSLKGFKVERQQLRRQEAQSARATSAVEAFRVREEELLREHGPALLGTGPMGQVPLSEFSQRALGMVEGGTGAGSQPSNEAVNYKDLLARAGIIDLPLGTK